MAADTSVVVSGADALNALLLCGVMGVVGQGARAAVGLKNANAPGASSANAQSAFSAAYLSLSLMIGFIAGVLAGFVTGLQNFVSINLTDPKLLLGIAVSGYAGADFIENALSLFIPKTAPPPAPAAVAEAAPAIPAALPVTPSLPPPTEPLTAALNIVLPRVSATIWTPALITAFRKYDFKNNRRIAAALGQFAVEAGAGFQELAENLNYSSAERLHDIFPHAFPTVDSAVSYVDKPLQIANRVYANENGNGDVASGDGYRFRGRGLIQITGREKYTEFAATIGKTADDIADYCETPEGAAMSGCWFLASHGCLALADAWDLSTITRKVNGPKMLGAAQRAIYANDFLKHLGGS